MILNDVYIVSQIVAAILVVPTLLYLALQVRQNTKQLKAAARYQFVEATGQMNAGIANDKQAASVIRRGFEKYESLDADERCQFFFFIAQQMQIHSVMFELYEEASFPRPNGTTSRRIFCRLSAPTVEGASGRIS